MLALNVDRATNRLIAERGLAAVSPAEREGVGDPAPARAAYRDRLSEVFKMHPAAGNPPTGSSASCVRNCSGTAPWPR